MTEEKSNADKESPFDFIMRRGAELGKDFVTGSGKEVGKSYVTKAEIAQQKKEWEEQCRLMREEAKKEDPIVKYCDDIRGLIHDYELSFEESKT